LTARTNAIYNAHKHDGHIITIFKAESRLNNAKSPINNLFLIGAGFTKAVFPDAPLNKDLFHSIVNANPKPKLNLYSKKYGTEDIEILLTRLDVDIAETESKTQAALAQNLVIGGSGLRREDNFVWLLLTSFLNKELQEALQGY
jgi:hypothetical protein